MSICWDNFTHTEWDGFTHSEWDSFTAICVAVVLSVFEEAGFLFSPSAITAIFSGCNALFLYRAASKEYVWIDTTDTLEDGTSKKAII